MNNVRQEIRDLITINDKIQSALLRGDPITVDEATLIRQCASELLENIPAPKEWTKPRQVVDGQPMCEGTRDSSARP